MSSTQSQQAYQALRQLLIYGEVAPGRRITEADWADRLAVNRSALREALMVLAHEGLLRRGGKGGYFVPVWDLTDLEQLLEVRLILEVGALRLIGRRPADESEQQHLEAVNQHMQQMIDGDYLLGFVDTDRRFHQTLVGLGQNPRLVQLYAQAPLPLLTGADIDIQTRRHNAQQTLNEHQSIQRLLLERDIPAAIEMLERHLRRTIHQVCHV